MSQPIAIDTLKSYLWGAAVNLRGQIDATAYKDYIFPLVFLKRICDVHDEEYQGYLDEGGQLFADMMIGDSPIQIPEGAHWRDVFNTTEDLGQKLKEVFTAIENANPPRKIDDRLVGGLNGIFGDKTIWTNKIKMPDSIIRDLLNNFNQQTLSLAACPADEMGTGYEYLIGQFADDAGHTAQEFYTNRTVVELMAEILQLRPHESIYDPTCGSGGMLIKSLTYLKDRGEEWRDVQVYGQEINSGTAAIARMNCYLHGIHDFSIVNDDTLERPAFISGGRVRQFDVVLANPPYSISSWNREKFQHDPYKRNFLGTPPQGRADYAFIQHILASMDYRKGRSAILLPHGVLNRMTEKEIRKNLIEADLVDTVISVGKNLFFNSPMEACILICQANKPEQRKRKIQFIRATDLVERKGTESYLTKSHLHQIKKWYDDYLPVEGRVSIVDITNIPEDNFSISPKLHVKDIFNHYDDYDFDTMSEIWQSALENNHQDLNVLMALINENS